MKHKNWFEIGTPIYQWLHPNAIITCFVVKSGEYKLNIHNPNQFTDENYMQDNLVSCMHMADITRRYITDLFEKIQLKQYKESC